MEKNCCVSMYASCESVEPALGYLQQAGLDLQQVSLVGKLDQRRERPIGLYRPDGRIRYCGPRSTFWEGVWNMLPDAACLWVPGIGVLAAAGRLVGLMVHDRQRLDMDGGFSVPGAALYSVGVPRCSIEEYEQAVRAEKYLLLVHGQRQDVERACGVLHDEKQQVTVHSA